MKIKAAIANSDTNLFSIQNVELDTPRDDEVLVKVVGVGICHSDLIFQSGETELELPAVLGHEASGVVERVGSSVTKVAVGDRVLITFNSCGVCPSCSGDHPAYCKSYPELNYAGKRLDGSKAINDDSGPISSNFFGQSSFATHSIAYERNLVKLPDDVPLELMGPLSCAVQTGVGAVTRSLKANADDTLLVTGGGSVGLSAVMGGAIQGCRAIIVVEPDAARRELAMELGATHVIDPFSESDLNRSILEIVPEGVDFVVETTGIPSVQNDAMAALSALGVLGLVGVGPADAGLPGSIHEVIGLGHSVRGIVEGDSIPDEFIPELVDLYKSGALPFDKLIKTFPFSEINKAVSEQKNGACIKAVLLLEESLS